MYSNSHEYTYVASFLVPIISPFYTVNVEIINNKVKEKVAI